MIQIKQCFKVDWRSFEPVRPSFLGTRVFDNYDLTKLVRIFKQICFGGYDNSEDGNDNDDVSWVLESVTKLVSILSQ